MRLNQLKIDFVPEQDRLLMQLSTSESVEVRISTQPNPEARRALLGIEHEQAISRADFSRRFEEGGPRQLPLGEEPILLASIQTGRDARGLPVVAMHPTSGQGLTLAFDAVLLHSVCKLLQAAVLKSDWDVELTLPGVEAPQEERPPRTLN